ncbi:hypothetical protein AAE02nite_23600 [Adhaeribacter aerolatus]|uniref:Serine protease n=1 Tax=Adhaeribacter aerolatus TaxID=670289 RepID=A0A512AYA4_9BACT|nr:endonuclease [Adhaeribacter aerolatus]GEO04696.1 hypothetical protein AAE02nite_23600 [Adhaeribacter aerolatus]
MDFYKTIAEQAAARWQARENIREGNKQKLQHEGVVAVESADRIQMRLNRLSAAASKEKAFKASSSLAASLGQGSPTSFLIENVSFERVIGKSDFLGMDFLELALAVSRFVCRIQIRNSPGRTIGYGTGFMVSPRLLITNNHVLSSAQEAVNSEVEFDYQYDRYGRLLPVVTYGLEPQAFFMTDKNLDFTIVAVRERSFNDIELKRFGWNRLIADQGKVIHGDTLNIVQHPQGEAKQIVLRSNRLVDLLDDFAHYETDTEPGSSGSPVYNDQWEVVALHHSGVPKMEGGNLIAKDGSVWRNGMDPNDLVWVANEGVRVSSIVNFVKKQRIATAWEPLRDELLHKEPPHPFEAAAMASITPTNLPQPTIAAPGGGNSYTFTIPLHITVQVGSPQIMPLNGTANINQAAPVNAITGVTSGADTASAKVVKDEIPRRQQDSPDLREALQELEAARNEPYYDQAKDKAAKEAYYKNIQVGDLSGRELYEQLHELLEKSHTTRLTYNQARHQHLYPRVDLHPDKMLHSIYTGEVYAPETFIRNDFEITERLESQAREQLSHIGSLSEAAMAEHLDILEAGAPYNAEHVVPQSWFAKRDPMKSDLHHLFACETTCNSFRGNTPFFEFADFEEAIRQGCGKREGNSFEPSQGHGAVARATLYFMLRYPGEINNNAKEYTNDRIEMLLGWHEKDPVSKYEFHRNAEIFKVQGNRNPLIDHPEWVGKIDFAFGLG